MNRKIVFGGIAITVLLIAAGFYFLTSRSSEQKVYRVGILSALAYFDDTITGFKQKMTELGYIEGKNIFYDVQKASAPVGNQNIIKKFVDDKVDLILVYPTEASLEAKEGTKGTNIPLISTEAYMEGNGLIESIQRPGGNLTGVRFPITEVALKRFEILHELAPNAKRILVPYLKDYPTVAPSLAVMRPKAAELRITLVEAPFSTPEDVQAYVAVRNAAPDLGIDAILMVPEPLSIVPPLSDPLYAFAETHAIPVAGVVVSDSDRGPIFSLIPSALEIGKLAAPLADKVFKGVPPGTIPIVTPESDLVINYKVAKRLGLTISESLLSTASRIVH